MSEQKWGLWWLTKKSWYTARKPGVPCPVDKTFDTRSQALAEANRGGDSHNLEVRPYPATAPVFEVTKLSNPKDAIGDTKVPLWLLSPIAKAHWALAQFAGMIKYGSWNWRVAGVRSSVYLSAAQRHLDAYLSGEEHDPIDGTHHLGNVMACCAILLDAQAAGKFTDDRPPSVDIRRTYAFVEPAMTEIKAAYVDKKPKHYTIADTESST